MLNTKNQLHAAEARFLAPYAMKSIQSLGRVYPENSDMFRLPFQRDRDRIIHSKSFRRLQAKTQVFVSYFGDHYRDRMTHSVEVAQIARDLARTLGLNEDLCECLALAHDLGHPPFGHGGESALNDMMQQFNLHFEHNEQSRRILEKLEKPYPDFDGLNCTKEVLDGLLKHDPHHYHTFIDFAVSPHLESQIVDLSDEIAYINHDLDDGLRSGIITMQQLQDFRLWQKAFVEIKTDYPALSQNHNLQKEFYGRIIARMIRFMIYDLQDTTSCNLEKYTIDSVEKFRSIPVKLSEFSESMKKDLQELRNFLMRHFYLHPTVNQQIEKGQKIIKKLFHYYFKNPSHLPEKIQSAFQNGERPEIVIKDYIAGMTDHFAEEQWKAFEMNKSQLSGFNPVTT